MKDIPIGSRSVATTREQIADQYGISTKTLKRWMQNAGIEIPRGLICPANQEKIHRQFTFFRQHQKETTAGETPSKPHPDDMEHAISLLKNALFHRADELSASARSFYHWLQEFLSEEQTDQFTVFDVHMAKRIHRRTLNRYLRELCLSRYIQIAGGNRHRDGYQYKIANIRIDNILNKSVENILKKTIKSIKTEYAKKSVGQ